MTSEEKETPNCYGQHSTKIEESQLYCSPCGFKEECKKEERKMSRRLDYLKKALHPEKQINIIDQCEIIAEALGYGGDYEEDIEGLAIYLEISESKVYQMNYIHHNMIPEMKEWFRGTEYQCHTTYDRAKLPVGAQEEFMAADDFINKYRDNTSDRTIINKEEN